MSKFDDMIYGLQQDIEIPGDVWMKYMDTLSRLPEKQKKRPSHIHSKRKPWPAAAAVILLASTISVSAAAYIQWSKGLEEGMQITPEKRQLLEERQMVSYGGESVTQGDVTMTVQQSIVDNYFAYLSFKVEGYQAEDGVQPGFSSMSLVVGDDGEFAGNWSGMFYNGLAEGEDGKAAHPDGTPVMKGETESYIMEDGSMEYQIVMMSYEKGYFINKPIHVELRDLGAYTGKAGDVAVDVEGVWSFDWILAGSDAIKRYGWKESLGDSGATVLQAELSPISISLTYEFPRQEAAEAGTKYVDPPLFTGVRLKDGTICTGLMGGGISGYKSEDSDIYECIVSLRRVIDVEQVESLLFIKSRPEGDQPLTEENLYFLAVE